MTCRTCAGWGGRLLPGGYWDPPEYADCPRCLGVDLCPFCGQGVEWTDDHSEPVVCNNAECDWKYGDEGDEIPGEDDLHHLADLQHENDMEEYP